MISNEVKLVNPNSGQKVLIDFAVKLPRHILRGICRSYKFHDNETDGLLNSKMTNSRIFLEISLLEKSQRLMLSCIVCVNVVCKLVIMTKLYEYSQHALH